MRRVEELEEQRGGREEGQEQEQEAARGAGGAREARALGRVEEAAPRAGAGQPEEVREGVG